MPYTEEKINIHSIVFNIVFFIVISMIILLSLNRRVELLLSDYAPEKIINNYAFAQAKNIPTYLKEKGNNIIWTTPKSNKTMSVKYNLSEKNIGGSYNFITKVGMQYPESQKNQPWEQAEVKLFVKVNGKVLKTTQLNINGRDKLKELKVSINNAKNIELCIDSLGTNWGDDLVWINPRLIAKGIQWPQVLFYLFISYLWIFALLKNIPLELLIG